MIPLTTRDAADWSMICAYLRLDDEGRKRVIEEIEYQTSRMMKEREEERRAWLSKRYLGRKNGPVSDKEPGHFSPPW